MNRHSPDLLSLQLETKNYREEGYQQGLEDGKRVKHKDEIDKIMNDIYSKYSPEKAQIYRRISNRFW